MRFKSLCHFTAQSELYNCIPVKISFKYLAISDLSAGANNILSYLYTGVDKN